MATFKIQTEAPRGGSAGDVLPDGEYTLTIDDAKIEEDQFAQPERDGSIPQKLVITWLLEEQDITPRQKKRGAKPGKKIWSRYGLFFYTKSDGNDTAFKALLTALDGATNQEGVAFDLAEFEANADAFEPADLIGIKARCLVETYKKTKGANVGQDANKVTKVLPVEDEADEEPAPPARRPAAAPRGAVPPKNRPQPVGDDEIPF
jgi:hypothetical protein